MSQINRTIAFLFVSLLGTSSVLANPFETVNLSLPLPLISDSVSSKFVGFAVDESSLLMDLNGDGDFDDRVAHVFDVDARKVRNISLSGSPKIRGSLIVVPVPESSQGETDLNGDGDSRDAVAHIYDPQTNSTRNLGIAINAIGINAQSENLVAFNVEESRQGMDLNNDQDRLDTVVVLYDAISDCLHLNLGGFPAAVSDSLAVFSVEEADARVDLNNDGDMDDRVMHAFNPATGRSINLGVEFRGLVRMSNSFCIFVVAEGAEGTADLNGDGDIEDLVYHAYDFDRRMLLNLQLASQFFMLPRIDGDIASFTVDEFNHGADLNGDGDMVDRVVHVFDRSDHSTTNLGVQASNFVSSERLVAAVTQELRNGEEDLNGDGDTIDAILHVYDTASRLLTNTGLALHDPNENDMPAVTNEFVAFSVFETAQDRTDLNGDGRLGGRVVHVFDPDTGEITNLGLSVESFEAGSFVLRADNDLLCFPVSETRQGRTDLNGDGQVDDLVAHVYRHKHGVVNLEVALSGLLSVAGEVVYYVVDELKQRMDLNGDGDLLDRIPFVSIIEDSEAFGSGTVNAGGGEVTNVLRVNGSSGIITVTPEESVELSFDCAPLGPLNAEYCLWLWTERSRTPTTLEGPAGSLGCTINPTPWTPSLAPQPFRCLRSTDFPNLFCRSSIRRSAPERVPFVLRKSQGLPRPITLTVQGLVQDAGSVNSVEFSVTNAITLQVF